MIAAGRPRLRDLVASEWIKLWSLRSTFWVLGLGGLATVGICVESAVNTYNRWSTFSARSRADFDPLQSAFSGKAMLVLILVTTSVGAIAVVSEYATGLVRTTFTAVPARHSVVAAKVMVMAAVMTAYGFVVAGASFWSTQAVLAGRHAGYSITHPGALQALVATALLPTVCATVGMGVGAVIRHTAATIAAIVFVLELLPQFFTSTAYQSIIDIEDAMPRTAWERLVMTHRAGSLLPSVSASWLVYALWIVSAAALAIVVVRYQDL